jgi:hypothetical protein
LKKSAKFQFVILSTKFCFCHRLINEFSSFTALGDQFSNFICNNCLSIFTNVLILREKSFASQKYLIQTELQKIKQNEKVSYTKPEQNDASYQVIKSEPTDEIVQEVINYQPLNSTSTVEETFAAEEVKKEVIEQPQIPQFDMLQTNFPVINDDEELLFEQDEQVYSHSDRQWLRVPREEVENSTLPVIRAPDHIVKRVNHMRKRAKRKGKSENLYCVKVS